MILNIQRDICAVYRQNIMSDGKARKRVRAFKDGLTDLDDERSGALLVITDALVEKVDCDNRR